MTAPPVGPYNPNPKWPGGYVQVLRDQGIEESNIPPFLRWVRRFFAGHKGGKMATRLGEQGGGIPLEPHRLFPFIYFENQLFETR